MILDIISNPITSGLYVVEMKWNEMKWNIGTYSTSVDSRDFAMLGPLLWPATLIGRIQIKTAWRFNRFGSSWFADVSSVFNPMFSYFSCCLWMVLGEMNKPKMPENAEKFPVCDFDMHLSKSSISSLRKYMSTFCQLWRLISFPSTSTS